MFAPFDGNIPWSKVCLCSRHGDLRSTEWLVLLTIQDSRNAEISISQLNQWLKLYDCKLTLKCDDEGVIEKPGFNGGYQADAWFDADPIMPEMTRWEAFVNFVDPVVPGSKQSGSTYDVWDSYAILPFLRDLLSKQMLTTVEKEYIGPLTFQYFLNFRCTLTLT